MRTFTGAVLLSLLVSAAGSAPARAEHKILDIPVRDQETSVWCWAAVAQMVADHLGEEIQQCQQAESLLSAQARSPKATLKYVKPGYCCDIDLLEPSKERERCVQVGWPQWPRSIKSKIRGCGKARYCHWQDWKEKGRYRWKGKRWSYKGQWEECKDGDLGPDCIERDGQWIDCEKHYQCALSWKKLRKEIDQNRPIVFSWRAEGGFIHIMLATGYVSLGEKQENWWVVVNDPWPTGVGSRYLVPFSVYVYGWGTHGADVYDLRLRKLK